jgi:Fe-S-cluster-containing hydrogenase component 2
MEILIKHSDGVTNKLEAIDSTQRHLKLEVLKLKKDVYTSCKHLIVFNSTLCKQVCIENVITRKNEQLK